MHVSEESDGDMVTTRVLDGVSATKSMTSAKSCTMRERDYGRSSAVQAARARQISARLQLTLSLLACETLLRNTTRYKPPHNTHPPTRSGAILGLHVENLTEPLNLGPNPSALASCMACLSHVADPANFVSSWPTGFECIHEAAGRRGYYAAGPQAQVVTFVGD